MGSMSVSDGIVVPQYFTLMEMTCRGQDTDSVTKIVLASSPASVTAQEMFVFKVEDMVSLSTIMDTAGMISVIATALAVATGSLYPLFAPVIGCLGTFITGSDTSSNILFGKLQANVAGHIQVSPDWLSAANTVGATGGKIISPQSIAIATSAGNQQGKEGEILKSAIPYALAYVLITGVIVYIFS